MKKLWLMVSPAGAYALLELGGNRQSTEEASLNRKNVKCAAGKAAKRHQKVRKFVDELKRPRKGKRGRWRVTIGGSPP